MRILVILIFFYLPAALRAQIEIKHITVIQKGTLNINELQNIQIDNRTNRPQLINITCTIGFYGKIQVAEYKLPPVLLKPGMQPYLFFGKDTAGLSFSNDSISGYFYQNQEFPPGNYQVCYKGTVKVFTEKVIPLCYSKVVTDTTSGSGNARDSAGKKLTKYILNRADIRVGKMPGWNEYEKEKKKLDSLEASRKKYFERIKKELKKPDIKFTGTAQLNYGYTENPAAGNLMPTSFFIGEITPRITLYKIPLTGKIFYTFDPATSKPDFHQFNVSFDRQQFMYGLLQRVQGVPGLQKPSELLQGNYSPVFKNPDLGTNTLLNPITQQVANSNMGLNSFNDYDKTVMQKYRYDKESLMKYKDSLDWADPSKAKQLGKIMDQMEFMNNLHLLEQQDVAKGRIYEDSLRKTDPEQLMKLKEGQAGNMVQQMEKNNWPDNPSKLAALVPMSKAEKLFYNIHSLSVGKSYLNYSPMSISGVSVTGVDASYATKQVYLQGSYGVLDMKESLWFQNDFSQKYSFSGAKVGWGCPEKSHVHFIYLDFSPKDIKVDTAFGIRIPVKNTLMGTEAVLSPSRYLSFRIEWFKSASKFQSAMGTLESESRYDSASAKDVLSHDAIRFSTVIQTAKSGTSIVADANRIGAEYHTLGNPYLRNNVYNYGFNVSQALLKKVLFLRGGFKQEMDNLVHSRNITTMNIRYDAGIMLSIPKLPFLTINYTPLNFYQKTPKDQNYILYAKSENFNSSMVYNCLVFKKNLRSSVLFSHITNINNLLNSKFDVYNYVVHESYEIKPGSNIQGLFSCTRPRVKDDSLKITSLDLSYSVTLKKSGFGLFGIKLSNMVNRDLIYLYTKSGFNFYKRYSATLYVYYNIYHPDIAPLNNMVQLSLSASW
jgi:hypothetical protein